MKYKHTKHFLPIIFSTVLIAYQSVTVNADSTTKKNVYLPDNFGPVVGPLIMNHAPTANGMTVQSAPNPSLYNFAVGKFVRFVPIKHVKLVKHVFLIGLHSFYGNNKPEYGYSADWSDLKLGLDLGARYSTNLYNDYQGYAKIVLGGQAEREAIIKAGDSQPPDPNGGKKAQADLRYDGYTVDQINGYIDDVNKKMDAMNDAAEAYSANQHDTKLKEDFDKASGEYQKSCDAYMAHLRPLIKDADDDGKEEKNHPAEPIFLTSTESPGASPAVDSSVEKKYVHYALSPIITAIVFYDYSKGNFQTAYAGLGVSKLSSLQTNFLGKPVQHSGYTLGAEAKLLNDKPYGFSSTTSGQGVLDASFQDYASYEDGNKNPKVLVWQHRIGVEVRSATKDNSYWTGTVYYDVKDPVSYATVRFYVDKEAANRNYVGFDINYPLVR